MWQKLDTIGIYSGGMSKAMLGFYMLLGMTATEQHSALHPQ
jgi:hypothetical protein